MSNGISFAERLNAAIESADAPCVVGLDPRLDYIPESIRKFLGVQDKGDRESVAKVLEMYCLYVLDQIKGIIPVIKPQMAYFERYGAPGIAALESCIKAANELGFMVILDGKRGDIGSTSEAYAQAYLGKDEYRGYEVDALTVNPYMGKDSLKPFVDTAAANGKGLFVLVRTSNPGSKDIQGQLLHHHSTVFEEVADKLVSDYVYPDGHYDCVGAVVGATDRDDAQNLRKRMPNTIFLVPGYGAQGGGPDTVRACFNKDGTGAIVNSSRAIMYPHIYSHTEDIRKAAQLFASDIREARVDAMKNAALASK